jgi:methionine synthase II (cobalamin-independent)
MCFTLHLHYSIALFGLTIVLNSAIEYHVKMFAPFATTGIGSLPHTDSEEACRLVLETFDIPFWPQLPKLSFRESMISQYSEGMPFIKIDEQKEITRIERDMSDALTRFYEIYSEDLKLSISEGYAKGLYTFIGLLKDKRLKTLKGQITGPLTFSLGLKDSEGRPVYFDEELREISLMLLKTKIRWQIEILKPYAEDIIIFIDEPILSALGSTSYISVDPKEALRVLREITDAIKYAGGIPGIHCCGKADWQLVINSNVRIVSFDAYGYIETISMYPAEFTEFLNGGGYLAWGIIPTTDSIREENPDSIKRRFDKSIERISKLIPATLLLSKMMLTPSCGTGSRSIEETIKVFQLLVSLKKAVS